MAKKNKTAETKTKHYCYECANVTPVTRFNTMSVHGKMPTLGTCPYWKQSRCVLMSQEACETNFIFNNNMAEKKETKNLSELVYIQSSLKAPKNQRNNFGGYNYRSCEDIMEAVKPLLKDVNCTLTVSDDIVQVGDRIYVKATARLKTPSGEVYENTAFAREAQSKKGMDESQVTGATSSYARKYALNGLFCIDDTKDADALNTSNDYTRPVSPAPQPAKQQISDVEFTLLIQNEINAAKTTDGLLAIWNKYPSLQKNAQFSGAITARKDQILNNGKS